MDPELPKAVAEAAASAGWLRLAHVLGAVVYVGAVLSAARLLAILPGTGDPARAAGAALGRRVYVSVALPALLLLLGAGGWKAFVDPGWSAYGKQPWFHVKLTMAVLLLVADHLMVLRPLKALAKGGPGPAAGGVLLRAAFWVILFLTFVLLVALFLVRRP